MRMNTWLLTVLTYSSTFAGPSDDPGSVANGVVKIRAEAAALKPIVISTMAQTFLDAAAHLPTMEGRVLLRDKPNRKYFSRRQAARWDPCAFPAAPSSHRVAKRFPRRNRMSC